MYSKKEAIKIVSKAAKDYGNKLEGRNLLFVYRERKSNSIDFFETLFLANNFQHLTGIEMVDSDGHSVHNANAFYEKCIHGKLKESEIRFKKDGTTELKLNAIPYVVSFIDQSKMTGLYSGNGLKLAIDRVVGNISCCLGLIKRGSYFYPGSCLLEDTRNIVDTPSQILAILSKSAENKEPLYKDIRYETKGFRIEKANLPKNLSAIISLEESLNKNNDLESIEKSIEEKNKTSNYKSN